MEALARIVLYCPECEGDVFGSDAPAGFSCNDCGEKLNSPGPEALFNAIRAHENRVSLCEGERAMRERVCKLCGSVHLPGRKGEP